MRVLLLLVPSLLVACESGSVKLEESGGADLDEGGDTGDAGVVDGAIEVSPGEIVLDTIFVGQTATATIEVTNVGAGAVDVTLSVAGGWATSYTLDAYTASPAAGETSVHTLTLTPTAWGDHAVSVLVEDAVSGGQVEVRVTASVQEDADGDGFGSAQSGGEDCDDADATRYPAAEDAWYDGVDSDCAGNDDYDQDGDGWVPDAYLGLPTAGVDGSGALPGGDCGDTDATIHPGAADAWYDGIDSDCAGNDDADQDGDGSTVDLDCDDTDASAYPGAPETWYDGVDGDCAGDDDYDQDGDGVDYPTDCNDTDPTVVGPEAETLDGIDNDCSGVVDDFPVDELASGVLYGTASGMNLGDHGLIALTGDLTGDGDPDLVLGGTDYGYGYVYVVDGATAAAAAGLASAYDTATVSGDSGYYPIGWVNGPFGDVDGDGDDDLLVGGQYTSSWGGSSYGRSYLLDGGPSLAGSVSASSYAARFSGDSDSDDSYQAASGDLDGDGLADVIVGSPYDNYGSSTYSSSDYDAGSVAVFLGADIGSAAYDLDDASDRTYGDDDYDYLGYSVVVADLDGDGYLDALASAPGYDGTSEDGGTVFLFAGEASLDWNDRAADARTAQFDGDSRELALGEDTLAHPGDVDGDGALDVGFTSEASGEAWVFLGTSGFSGTTTLSAADWSFAGTAGDLGSMLVMDSDLDGDGADDVVLGADGDDTAGSNAGAVFVYTGGSWGTSVATSAASVTLWGTASNGYFGSGGAGGQDLDADGREDVVVGEVTSDLGASDGGAAWIVLGW